ncbi:MAG: dephospho-CoA kinase [Gammaproteobacteria bacterium]|nr:dephospho-CoA kinase [Gammaproteobacteria bacterium]
MQMLVIAITGGIGSGKSTVADFFKSKGAPVVDTDAIARQLVQPNSPLLNRIIEEFGRDYLDTDGHLKRKALGRLIFADPAARDKLEKLMHPAIHAEVVQKLKELKEPYCLVLIPLLARSKHAYPYDRILVVDAPEQIQVQRTVQRDQHDPEFVRQIMGTQPSRQELLAIADDVLDNSGDLDALALAVDKLHRQYLALATRQS